MTRQLLLASAIVAASGAAFAQEEVEPWQASVELGAISTTGNTETLSIQSRGELAHDLGNWQNKYVASVLFKDDEVRQPDGTERTERTAERYFASAKGAYELQEDTSNLFIFGSHTRDEFGAYLNYSTLALGYGRRWLDTPNAYLDAEVGPGYFRGERVLEDGTTDVEKGAMIRGALEFQWSISDNATFSQDVSVESGSDNTRTIAETALTTKINNSLQMKVGFAVVHNSEVAADKEPTDTTTSVNLVYSL